MRYAMKLVLFMLKNGRVLVVRAESAAHACEWLRLNTDAAFAADLVGAETIEFDASLPSPLICDTGLPRKKKKKKES